MIRSPSRKRGASRAGDPPRGSFSSRRARREEIASGGKPNDNRRGNSRCAEETSLEPGHLEKVPGDNPVRVLQSFPTHHRGVHSPEGRRFSSKCFLLLGLWLSRGRFSTFRGCVMKMTMKDHHHQRNHSPRSPLERRLRPPWATTHKPLYRFGLRLRREPLYWLIEALSARIMGHLARSRLRAALGGGVPSRSLTMTATGPTKG